MPELRLDDGRYHNKHRRGRRSRLLAAGALIVVAGAVVAVVAIAGGGGSEGNVASAGRSQTSKPPKPTPQKSQASPKTTTSPSHTTTAPPTEHRLSLSKLLGQLLVGSFSGTVAPGSLLARIRAGQLGGVILFSANTAAGPSATRVLITKLQRIARSGGNPPLLIMADQEGGEVRRLPGPPTMNADQITSTAMAHAEGVDTGKLLHSIGVNVDLAPVSDVQAPTGSFLGPRAFGTNPAAVGALACAFASGLAGTGVAYTLKHFPGLGLATTSTDTAPVTISASSATLEASWDAYHLCGSGSRALVMVSNAIYPNLTGSLPAVESPETYSKVLPLAVGHGDPVTVSDDLMAGALTNQPSPALPALDAGLDIAMYAASAHGSQLAFSKLLSDAHAGLLPRKRLVAAEEAVAALKKEVAG